MCEKRAYKDRLSAMLMLAGIKASQKGHRAERRIYQCGRCHSWHLTSREMRGPASAAA